MLSEKQDKTFSFVKTHIEQLIKYHTTFRIAILGNTGIKHVLTIIKKEYEPKGIYFPEINLKTDMPIEIMNQITRSFEQTLSFKSEYPTDKGKFQDIVSEFRKKKSKEIVMVIRNFTKYDMAYLKELQLFFDFQAVSVIFCSDKHAYEEITGDIAIKKRCYEQVECGFFESIDTFEQFCKEQKIDFNKYKDCFRSLTFNQISELER